MTNAPLPIIITMASQIFSARLVGWGSISPKILYSRTMETEHLRTFLTRLVFGLWSTAGRSLGETLIMTATWSSLSQEGQTFPLDKLFIGIMETGPLPK